MEVSVIGAGTMGHALALLFGLGGHHVRLTDCSPQALDRAQELMRSALHTLREAGEIDCSWTDEKLGRVIHRCESLAEAVQGADFVIEAIVEQAETKRRLFTEIDALAGEEVILASNTSQLNVFPLIPARRQRRSLIMHWYTPPYLVDLVDIVVGPDTDPAVVERARETAVALGKVPVVLRRFLPGYIANRIQAAITLEVLRLLDEGYATPRDVDDAVIHGLALRMPILGHLAKADFTGLHLSRQMLANRTYEPPPVRGRSETLDRLVEQGHTGVRSGRGYFDWGGREASELFRERDRRLLALKRALRAIRPLTGT